MKKATKNIYQMNIINYLKKVFILTGLCVCVSCNSHEYDKVTIVFDNTCNLSQQSNAYEVINKRVASIWRVKEKTELIDGKFDLTYQFYSGEEDLLAQILMQTGEIFVAEMYSNSEIQSPLSRVYERLYWLMENPDLRPLWQTNSVAYQTGTPIETYELISVPLQQILFMDSIFNQYKQIFPRDISFVWTAKSDNDDFFSLLALKSIGQPFFLNSNSVKSCNIEYNEYKDGETTLNYQEIIIALEKDYCDEWARMTRNNIGKNLAIVMDGKVLMYPRVHSEIINGKMGVTGNYEDSELLLIKSVILGGALDCKAEILSQ